MVDFKIGSVDRSLVTTSTSTEDIKKQLETVSIDPNVTFTTGHPFPCPIIDLACPVCSTDDFLLKIPSRVVKLARNSKWGGKDKMDWYAKQDGKSPEICGVNRFVGNVGELTTFIFTKKELKIPCGPPNLETEGVLAEWFDDLKVFKSLSIKRNGLITPIVGKHIGIKTQTTESAARWGESYMYQRKTPTRSGDPLLKGPSNHLIATVLVKPPANLNSDEGWEMRRPKFFLWADVFSQLKDPRVKRLIGEKYVFYMNDIKYLELPTSSIVVENDI